jgi:glycogen operon protein
MTDQDWQDAHVRSLGVRLAGDAIQEKDHKGHSVYGDTLLLLFNANHESLSFTLPAHQRGVRWEILVDTSDPEEPDDHKQFRGGTAYELKARSTAVLRLHKTR